MHAYRAMGYLSYRAYLQSSLWAKIRARVMGRDGWRCTICQSTNHVVVHHRSYDMPVMQGRDDSKLVTVCGECHESITFAPDGTKRSMDKQITAELAMRGNKAAIRALGRTTKRKRKRRERRPRTQRPPRTARSPREPRAPGIRAKPWRKFATSVFVSGARYDQSQPSTEAAVLALEEWGRAGCQPTIGAACAKKT